MKRNVSLEEISDGRLYGRNDMVKADCRGCVGCHKCCAGMGNSIILDPYDVWRLRSGLGKSLQQLLEEGKVQLNVVDGCILPNLRMATGGEQACAFLDERGRCGIHPYRPGVCRLFPLGRYYEKGDFKFFLQTGECVEKNRTKIRVSKWIDTPEQGRNHDFLCRWHDLLNRAEEAVAGQEDGEFSKTLNISLLNTFYFEEFSSEQDFYKVFDVRCNLFLEKFRL